MFFIPAWITNILLLVTCWISAYQIVNLERPNPVKGVQFWMVLFCLLMVLATTLHNRDNRWLSLGFFLIAIISLSVIYRQQRLLPPRKRIE
jgi:L-asparagine transporter-like permease